MQFTKLLLGSVAASGIMVLGAAMEPSTAIGIGPAQAHTRVSAEIGFNVFYDRLGDHGDWIRFRGRYVWVPDVSSRWRPYLHGHWVYTRSYGWYWVSDEPFGWAVYHYGRWAFHPELGWYWVPGRRWAPAWVAWSHTDDDIAWAPLPPDYDDDEFTVSISIGTVPLHYWHVVPIAFFISVDLDEHVIRDRDRIRRVVSRGDPETVVIQNNIVINNFIDIDIIEEKTTKQVVVYEERPAERPEGSGVAGEKAIAIFNPELEEQPEARPPKVKKIEKVIEEKKAAGFSPEEQLTEIPEDEDAADTQVRKKKRALEDTEEDEPAAQQAGEQPVKKKKRDAAQEEEAEEERAKQALQKLRKRKQTTEEVDAPSADQQLPEEQPVKKKRRRAAATVEEEIGIQAEEEVDKPVRKRKKAVEEVEEPTPDQTVDQPVKRKKRAAAVEEQTVKEEQAEEQPVKKRKKRAPDTAENEGGEQALGTQDAPEAGQQKRKARKKEERQQACDPETDDCPEE